MANDPALLSAMEESITKIGLKQLTASKLRTHLLSDHPRVMTIPSESTIKQILKTTFGLQYRVG